MNARVNASLPSLCKKISRGLPCPYEGKCKFSHDIDAFLVAAKDLPELGIPCPFASSTPPRRCNYGLSCRGKGCRVAFAEMLAARKAGGGGEDVQVDGAESTALTTHDDELNHLSRDVQAQLREVRGKGLYKYEKWFVEHAAYKAALAQERGLKHGDAGAGGGKHSKKGKAGKGGEGWQQQKQPGGPGEDVVIKSSDDARKEEEKTNATKGAPPRQGSAGVGAEANEGKHCDDVASCDGVQTNVLKRLPGLAAPPATPAPSSPGGGALSGAQAAGAHTHVTAHELGARLQAQGGTRDGEGGEAVRVSTSSSGNETCAAPAAALGHLSAGTPGLPAPPATPVPNSPPGDHGQKAGDSLAGAGAGQLRAGAETGVSAYELGARLRREEKRRLDFEGKTILAPLTTVGNLPFRRLCKQLGCDVTYGEMALASKIVEGNSGEWALFRRHKSEDMFGIQIAGAFADNVAKCGELFERECTADFFDLNCGCPIDQVTSKGMGAELLDHTQRLREIVTVASRSTSLPMTVKIRVGHYEDEARRNAHKLIPELAAWGASAVTLHGRSRQQRYNRLANWDYVSQCAGVAKACGIPLLGNGDVVSWEDYQAHMSDGNLTSCMVARGALIKPWLFTEIKEARYWDIRSSERLELIRDFCRYGLDHWGSDSVGVERTRSFLCEWQAWLCRYIPVGVLEVLPPKMNHRSPGFVPRDELEGLLAGDQVSDWMKISEMFLGPCPEGFRFTPKHRSSEKMSGDASVQVEG